MSSAFKPYLDQSYEKIKSDCLINKKLFVDEKFPPNSSSLYRFQNPQVDLTWKRPHDILTKRNPEFIVEKIVPEDIDQGQLGNCWFISGASNVANVKEFADRVIPGDQTFEDGQYAGIFKFRFWRNGEWLEVVVDDYLPVDRNNKLYYSFNNRDTNEMFGPLLEKAYAKLNICYEFLNGGDPIDAMIDMTGGVHEVLYVKGDDKTEKLSPSVTWEILFKSFQLKSLVGASINVKSDQIQEGRLGNGLVVGHAFSILDAFELVSNNGQYNELRKSFNEKTSDDGFFFFSDKAIKLLRLRNPWGEKKSYNGPWMAQGKEWNKVSDEIKSQLGYQDQFDGKFFMSFEDFLKYFDTIEIVHVNLNAFFSKSDDYNLNINWSSAKFNGAWVSGVNAGGCGNGDPEMYWINPQCCVSLKPENDFDSNCSVIISLMQTESVRRRAEIDGTYESSNEAISFEVYKIRADTRGERIKKFKPDELEKVFSRKSYINQRAITERMSFPIGDYVIIPSTFDGNVDLKFMLRVFIESTVEKKVNLQIASTTNSTREKSQVCSCQ